MRSSLSPRLEFAVFVGMRIVGVVIRPVTLLIALGLPDQSFADAYALVLTAVVSSFVVYSHQNHREVYAYFLGRVPERLGLGGKDRAVRYLDGVFFHLVLFAPVMGALVWIWAGDLTLWALIMPLVLIEKYYDDSQRALIYQRRYLSWSVNFLFRTVLPSGTLLAVLVVSGTASVVLYAGLVGVCWALYVMQFARPFLRLTGRWVRGLWRNGLPRLGQRVRAYLGRYAREYFATQVFGFFSVNILVIDRFLVSNAYPGIFAEYILAVNMFTAVPLVHNMFYFTRIRADLIDQDHPVLPTWFGWRNIVPPLMLSLGVVTGLVVAGRLGLVVLGLGPVTLAGLGLVYFLAAMSFVLQEFVFWRTRRIWLVLGDAAIFAGVGAAMLATDELASIPYILAAGLAVRCAIFLLTSTTTNARIRLPRNPRLETP